MRSVLKLSGLVLAALAVSACVAGPGAANPSSGTPATQAPTATPKPSPSGPPAIEHPTGKDSLVLRITLDGGFVPVGWTLTNLPVISIYGDGRVIGPGAQIMIYPGPILPSLWQRTITEEGLQKILAAAAEAGLLGADKQYELNTIADAPTTTFVINAGGRVHSVSAYALAEESVPDPNLSREDTAARKLLRAFLDQVTALPTLVGASELGAEQEYKPAGVRLFVTKVDPSQPTPTDVPEQDAVAWPLKNSPLATFGAVVVRGGALGDMRCGVVAGADLDTLWPVLQKANALTAFTDAGKSYTFLVRPLLPDESGCPDLQ